MKRFLPYVFVSAAAFSGFTCKKENACDCFKRTGDIVKETRQLPVFRNVFVEDNVNLIFTEDTIQLIEVEAGENLVKLVKTEMNGDELRIRNDNKCNFTRKYDIPVNVHIHYTPGQFHTIRSKGTGIISNTNPCTSGEIDLDINGSGDINFLMGDGRVLVHQHGVGDVTLKGSCDEIIIYTIGTGFTITDECTNTYTWIYTRTTGKITVCPTNLLISEIGGSGNVYYRGSPASIQSTQLGTGQLLPLE